MDTVNLTHNFLIAMPGMVDPNFNGTLTYICDHSDQGALGVVVNRPIDLELSTLFEQIGLSLPERLHHDTVYFGGPVQTERGFVLHTPPLTFSSTLTVNDAVSLTTSKDVLEAVSQGAGPEKFMVSLGYAGWSAGQLEDEIKQNAWLSVAADPQVIFDLAPKKKQPTKKKQQNNNNTNQTKKTKHA